MSLKERFVDGVSSLFEKLNDGEELGGVDPTQLERELARRVAAREKAGNPAASENAKARVAGAGSKAKAQRAAMAEKRVAKIHGERKRRADAIKSEQDAAFRKMAEEAQRNTPPRTAPPRHSSSSSSRTSSRSRRSSLFTDKGLAPHYKTLGVSADMEDGEIKSAYRKLMRKYHPDRHQDPRKKKAATELASKISLAYAEIEKSRK